MESRGSRRPKLSGLESGAVTSLHFHEVSQSQRLITRLADGANSLVMGGGVVLQPRDNTQ